MGSFLKLKQLLEEKNSFVLVCHVEPDGDAIGSMLALGEVLSGQGKEVVLVCKDPVPPVFRFLTPYTEICPELPNQTECLILLDNGDMRRTGFEEEIVKLKAKSTPIINIDHHTRNNLWKIVTVNYADETASSAAEIVYKILVGLDYEISPNIATNLLAGIYNDTGGFRHQNTSNFVLQTAAELLKKGAKLKKITDNIENSRSVALFKLWGIALERLRLKKELGLSYSIIRQVDLRASGACEDDISGLVNLLNSAPESKAALLLYESETGKIKGSLRTEKDDIDLSELARVLGGGGHKKAAGFSLEGKIEENGGNWKVV